MKNSIKDPKSNQQDLRKQERETDPKNQPQKGDVTLADKKLPKEHSEDLATTSPRDPQKSK